VTAAPLGGGMWRGEGEGRVQKRAHERGRALTPKPIATVAKTSAKYLNIEVQIFQIF